MKHTPLGDFCRNLRKNNHEVIKDVADIFGCSVGYISAIETGKRKLPEEWVPTLVSHYRLDKVMADQLQRLINEDVAVIKINLIGVSDVKKRTALAFKRSFDALDDETCRRISEVLNNISVIEEKEEKG